MVRPILMVVRPVTVTTYYEHIVFPVSLLFVLEFLLAFLFFVLLSISSPHFYLKTFIYNRYSNEQRIMLKRFNH